MKRCVLRNLVVVLLALCVPWIARAQSSPPVPRDTVHELLTGYADRFDAWEVTYELSTERYRELLLRRVAQRRGGDFLHLSAKDFDNGGPQIDPGRQRFVMRDGWIAGEWPHTGECALYTSKDLELPGTLPREVWFYISGWWCDSDWQAPRQIGSLALSIADIANDDRFEIIAEETLPSKLRAVVLEISPHPDSDGEPRLHDRLWVATDGEHGLLKRQTVDVDSGRVVYEMSVTSFERYDAYTVPTRIDLRRVVTPSNPDGPMEVMELRVVDYKLNSDVRNEVFSYQVPSDFVVFGESGSLVATTDQTGSFAEQTVDWSVRWGAAFDEGAEADRRGLDSGNNSRTLWTAITIALGGLGGFFITLGIRKQSV